MKLRNYLGLGIGLSISVSSIMILPSPNPYVSEVKKTDEKVVVKGIESINKSEASKIEIFGYKKFVVRFEILKVGKLGLSKILF